MTLFYLSLHFAHQVRAFPYITAKSQQAVGQLVQKGEYAALALSLVRKRVSGLIAKFPCIPHMSYVVLYTHEHQPLIAVIYEINPFSMWLYLRIVDSNIYSTFAISSFFSSSLS